jgi:hypothetical protein
VDLTAWPQACDVLDALAKERNGGRQT